MVVVEISRPNVIVAPKGNESVRLRVPAREFLEESIYSGVALSLPNGGFGSQ